MMKMITQMTKERLRRLEAPIPPMNLRNRYCRGQSIAEYLVVAAAILAAVVAISGPVQAAWTNLMNQAINKIGP